MLSLKDIFNRPPAISEDTLQYTIYLPPDQSDRVSATSLAALLSEHAEGLLAGHLWHRDAFQIKIAPDPEGNKDMWILEGRMRIGDCIDDEWCAVWVLRELSNMQDVVINVFDSDGDFLLIEAADELPSWVTPTNAENRVWIHNSHLHLIPLSHISPPSSKTRHRKYLSQRDSDEETSDVEDDTEFIIASEAVRLVRDPVVDTTAPQNVQDVVWKRISEYPLALRQHVHVTKAYLPIDVAKALAVNPLLIQKAVETFYTRDTIQLRAAQKMARFPPEPATLTSVKMTRTAYAQLFGQRFYPPKVFGRWDEREGEKEWRWRDVGMKIACGFEMLYQESKPRKNAMGSNFDGSPASLEALKDSLRRNADYTSYLQHLGTAGYFKYELEGSQLWTTLENKAASAFVAARRDDDASRPSFASVVHAAISQHADDRGFPSMDEDPDDWLNVDAADFDAMLEKNVDKGKEKEKPADAVDVDDQDRIAKAQAARLRNMAERVQDFVKGKGDIEGARFADEAFSDEDSDDMDAADLHDNESDNEDGVSREGTAKTLDITQLTAEERATRQAAMEKLVPGIDPSEYGKMPPSFHNNSQRVTPVTVETDIRDEILPGKGAEDSASGLHSRPIRPPILPRDDFDGVDSDNEMDEEDEVDDDDEEEDRPQVVGEVEIDMAEEEEEFIEFARQALGLTDEQWTSILRERDERGESFPAHLVTKMKHNPPVTNGRAPIPPPAADVVVLNNEHAEKDSFAAVMRALDEELARHTKVDESHRRARKGGKARQDGDAEMDIEVLMEAELKDLLNRNDSEDEESEREDQVNYQLIKNFLESFKSQGGLSGPVSTLVGRLQEGWTLPRDEV